MIIKVMIAAASLLALSLTASAADRPTRCTSGNWYDCDTASQHRSAQDVDQAKSDAHEADVKAGKADESDAPGPSDPRGERN